jgi:hydrogenase-4 component E
MIAADVADQIVAQASTAIVLVAIALAATRSIGRATWLLAAQSVLLAVAILALGLSRGSWELVAGAAIAFGVRGVAVPIVLRRILHASPVRHERTPYLRPVASLVVAIGIAFVSAVAVRDTMPSLPRAEGVALTAAIAAALTGLLLVVTRRKTVSMLIGLLAFENGIALAAFALTAGMPLLVELGVSFDLLILLVVVHAHSREMLTSFGSLSTDRLRNLRG